MLSALAALLLLTGCQTIDNAADQNAANTTASCYDYIIETMAQPQYWSDNPVYSSPEKNAAAQTALVNATGWKLTDLSSASFSRGYEGVLTISFADQSGTGTVNFGLGQNRGYQLTGGMVSAWLWADGAKQQLADPLAWLQQESYFKAAGYYERYHFQIAAAETIIETTMAGYEEKFAAAGCPLRGKPAGTLAAYKKTAASPVAPAEADGLIHYPWAQRQAALALFADSSIKQVTELIELTDYDGTWFAPGHQSVLLADQSQADLYYDNYYFAAVTENRTASAVSDNVSAIDRLAQFARLFVNECCRYRRQENCLRLADSTAFASLHNTKGIYIGSLKNNDDLAAMTLADGGWIIDGCYLLVFTDGAGGGRLWYVLADDGVSSAVYELFGQFIAEFDRAGLTFPFGDDYAANYVIWTDKQLQRQLGLR